MCYVNGGNDEDLIRRISRCWPLTSGLCCPLSSVSADFSHFTLVVAVNVVCTIKLMLLESYKMI